MERIRSESASSDVSEEEFLPKLMISSFGRGHRSTLPGVHGAREEMRPDDRRHASPR